MLTAEDRAWLQSAYPGLISTGDTVAGRIKFRGAYDANARLFLINPADRPGPGYAVLECAFGIRIVERKVPAFSALPALYLDGVEPDSDRHISYDKSACLCSPIEEAEFLTPHLLFRPYLEKLVIPFLYGQAYYSLHNRWPWPDYAHSATGILESYGKHPGPGKIDACLRVLRQCITDWPAVRAALLQPGYVKGHTPCFCKRKDLIRRCHPDALRGIQQLRKDITESEIDIEI